ncbi:MAG: helix-turn-helix domain-containing protein [Vicinamibacteria bacterium]|nr:helix-turn-helix domain-containing protein [Vicinamibacteria bacterium]
MTTTDTHDTYLSAREAAALIHMRPKTLANKRVYGDGPPYIRAGGRVLYSRRDLDEWLRARRRHSTSEHPAAA